MKRNQSTTVLQELLGPPSNVFFSTSAYFVNTQLMSDLTDN